MRRLLIVVFVIVSATFVCFPQSANENIFQNKQGDLWNGYYLNPILGGDYPDPTIVRDGKDYYMTHSSFDYLPGLVVLHSTDMVNWKPISFALKEYLGSIWAPDIVKHEGKFYIYFTVAYHPGYSNFVVWADSPYGPWSDPVDLKVGNIDPCHVVGEDGTRWMFLSGGNRVKLSDDGLSVIPGTKEKVYAGWKYPAEWVTEGFNLEGPKLKKIGDYYYLLNAQGGTAGPPTSHMVVVARSKSIDGPWENDPDNPLIHTSDYTEKWWSKGHGSLIDTPDGEWWIVYHAYKNQFTNMGRQTLLEPVEITEKGWLKVPLGTASEKPVRKPISSQSIENQRNLLNEFRIGLDWKYYKKYDPNRTSVENNTLTIKAQGANPAESAPLMFVAGSESYEFSAKVNITDKANAGLVIYYNADFYVGISFDMNKKYRWRKAAVRGTSSHKGKYELWLKLRNESNVVTGYISYDGVKWEKQEWGNEISGYNHNTLGDFQSILPGIFAYGEGEATFSDFEFTQLQEQPAWDNTLKRKWDPAFEEVEILSAKDGEMQKAYMYASKSKTPQPLIVSLHTWSGNYTQADPLTKEILARDWNYIHPDFRGANRRPEATGSPLVLSDIEDAIRYAVEHTNANPEEVHIIGVSGGGYATLLAYMNIDYPVKSFSAWAPISDIEAWYWESVGRGQKYAVDILKSVSTDSTFNREEAVRRSPIRHAFPIEKRKNSKLYIYEGVHDGYKGSVPITHSLHMYNRLVGELKYGSPARNEITKKSSSDTDLVSPEEILGLLEKRMHPEYEKNPQLYDRKVHLFRQYENVQLTIFEGGHEQIPQALSLLPYNHTVTNLKCNILTIGDSNGRNKGGWVDQLKKMMPESTIVNHSESGRTIGFDNGKESLNALKNIDSFLDKAQAENEQYDYIIVCLGTNDTKAIFDSRQGEVPENLSSLLTKIKQHKLCKGAKTKLIYVTPPPLRDENVGHKYQDSGKRLARLVPQLKAVALKQGFDVVDIFHPLLGVLDYYAEDGVHMAAPGQEIVASKIVAGILSVQKKNRLISMSRCNDR